MVNKKQKKWPTGSYENGYCRPPKGGQIKTGEVRNPWGPKGKPKPEEPDPFEFAASQMVEIIIDGQARLVTAETASHLRNMSAAVAGDHRAHKHVQDERRSRRRVGPVKTAEEVRQDMEEENERKRLSAQLMNHLQQFASLKREGWITFVDGKLIMAAWMIEAAEDYREKHGEARNPGAGETWSPHSNPYDRPNSDADKRLGDDGLS